MDYFLSYSRNIKADAEKFIVELELVGLNIWIDIDHITLGSNIDDTFNKILNKTKNALGAIILFDDTYLKKEWCNYEIDFFINNNINIYPILINVDESMVIAQFQKLSKYNFKNLYIDNKINIELIIDLVNVLLENNPYNLIHNNLTKEYNLLFHNLINDYYATLHTNSLSLNIVKLSNLYKVLICSLYGNEIMHRDLKIYCKTNSEIPRYLFLVHLLLDYLSIKVIAFNVRLPRLTKVFIDKHCQFPLKYIY